MLLEKGADINAQGGRYGNALQATSVSNGEIEATRPGESNDGFVDIDYFPAARAQQSGSVESIEVTSTSNNTNTRSSPFVQNRFCAALRPRWITHLSSLPLPCPPRGRSSRPE